MARRYWLKVDGQKITDSAMKTLRHAEAAAQHVASRIGKAVMVGYDEIAPRKRKAPARARPAAARRPKFRFARNPLMGGHDFTGEQWLISGVGRNGRKAMAWAETHAAADQTAEYLHANYGWRAITIRRLTAPRAPAKAAKAGRRR